MIYFYPIVNGRTKFIKMGWQTKGTEKSYKDSQEKSSYSLHRADFLGRWCEAERAQSQGPPARHGGSARHTAYREAESSADRVREELLHLVPEAPAGW